jgi:hypothetical protein
VDVICHEAEGHYSMPEAFNSFLKEEVEAVTVLILEENILSAIPTENHMVQGTWVMYSWFPWHG